MKILFQTNNLGVCCKHDDIIITSLLHTLDEWTRVNPSTRTGSSLFKLADIICNTDHMTSHMTITCLQLNTLQALVFLRVELKDKLYNKFHFWF